MEWHDVSWSIGAAGLPSAALRSPACVPLAREPQSRPSYLLRLQMQAHKRACVSGRAPTDDVRTGLRGESGEETKSEVCGRVRWRRLCGACMAAGSHGSRGDRGSGMRVQWRERPGLPERSEVACAADMPAVNSPPMLTSSSPGAHAGSMSMACCIERTSQPSTNTRHGLQTCMHPH